MKLSGFTKVNKNRKFNYRPVFYDEQKEEFQERVKKLEEKYGKDKNKKENKHSAPGHYTSNIKGRMKGYLFYTERNHGKFNFARMVILAISLILAIAIVMLVLKLLATIEFFNVFS